MWLIRFLRNNYFPLFFPRNHPRSRFVILSWQFSHKTNNDFCRGVSLAFAQLLYCKGTPITAFLSDETKTFHMQTAHPSNDVPAGTAQTIFPTLTAGQKLAGCYVLRGEKHAGAATSIWTAHDEVLGKDVALHFIPQAVRADEKAMDELRHQVKRNRQLIHPNILRIYDFIEDAQWAAVSTDAIEGECLADLRSKTTGGFFEVADVKPWLVQLCQTLDDAHKIQLVHGDLSPDHLFIGADGRVVAVDFGIGRCVRDALWRAGGAGAGTPPVENLSPQLLDGQAPSASDDIYATGVLLHELLAGRPPFSGTDLSGKIRNAAPGKVQESRSQMHKGGGPIPPNWEKVIAACLEKSPEQRPKSLADFSARLSLPKAGEEVAAAQEPAAPVKAEAPAKAETPAKTETSAKAEAPAEAQPAPREAGPVIPVVSKAWVGAAAKKSAPVFASKSQAAEVKENEVAAMEKTAAPESRKPLDQKANLENAVSEDYPTFGARRSGFPITGLAAAAILVALCVYAVFFGGFRKSGQADPEPLVHTESSAEVPQYAAVKNPISEPAPEKTVSEPVAAKPEIIPAKIESIPVVEAAPVPEPPVVSAIAAKPVIEAAPVLAANPKPAAAKPVATPIPATPGSEQGSGPSVAVKTAALEAARKSVEEWDKAHQAMLKKKEQAEAAIADATKALEEKMKSAAPMLKASDEVAALRQKREADRRAAELAAEEAKKAAEEKARLADEAKKAVENVEKENKDKLAGQRKVEAELDAIKKTIAENERVAAESAKLADGAMNKKEEQVAAVKQREQEVAMAMASAEIERQKKMEMEEKRSRIMKEMDEAKKLFEERMKALESSLKNPEAAATQPVKAPVEKAPVAVKPATPAPAPATPAPASVPEVPKPAASTAPALPAAESTLLVKMDPPPVPTVEAKPAPLTGGPTTNSLGMAFIPAGDVQFAIWPTRLKDFEAFATATGLKSSLWRDPGFKQGPDHPVVNVTWMEAAAFCKWLTFKEQREGVLPPGKNLPPSHRSRMEQSRRSSRRKRKDRRGPRHGCSRCLSVGHDMAAAAGRGQLYRRGNRLGCRDQRLQRWVPLDLSGGQLSTEQIRPLRHGRQRLAVGRGPLEHRLGLEGAARRVLVQWRSQAQPAFLLPRSCRAGQQHRQLRIPLRHRQ